MKEETRNKVATAAMIVAVIAAIGGEFRTFFFLLSSYHQHVAEE